MEATEKFKRDLFYFQNPIGQEFYEVSANRVFEKETSKTQIAAHFRSFDSENQCTEDNESEASVESKRKGVIGGQEKEEEHRYGQSWATKGGQSHGRQKGPLLGSRLTSDEDEECLSSIQVKRKDPMPAMDQRQADASSLLDPGPPELAFVVIAPSQIESFVQRTKHAFRVFCLQQRHSYSRLQITKEEFEKLLVSCHVFPRFKDYVVGFGSKTSELEVGPPPLKFRLMCTSRRKLYRGFECAYILRYVDKTNRLDGRRPWSFRQYAVYHRFKPALRNRCSTWIMIGASERTVAHLNQYARSVNDLFDANPIELHVIFLETAIASWRPYLAYLSQLVFEQSSKASGVSIHEGKEDENFVIITVEDHQQLKQIEDYVADLILCLDSTSDTLAALEEMYEQYCEHQNDTGYRFSDRRKLVDTDSIAVALTEKAREIAYTRRKAESLLSKVQNTRTLISSLLERQSGHNIDQQIAALQQLERQGQEENAIMRIIAEKNSRDSSSMRVLTTITMIYLPCTIVSNFYSTQFVNQTELDDGTTTLGYAQNTWLFFVISVPLTVFTFLVWYSWVHAGCMQRVVASRISPAQKAELPR